MVPGTIWYFLIIFLTPQLLWAREAPTIRVALLREAPEIVISGEELRLRLPEVKPVSYYIESPLHITPSETGLKIGGENYPYPYLKFHSLHQTLSLAGKKFEGNLEIRRLNEKKLMVLNELPLETYLIGLVHGEINANWPKEVIKAQVVAARTYALYRQAKRKQAGDVPRMGNVPYDLEASTADQVYVGSQGEKDTLVKKAIAETHGEVLWYFGYYPAYFHSSCGGQTEIAGNVWNKKEISVPVIDSFCQRSPYQNWELSLSPKTFLQKLQDRGLRGSRIQSIGVERYENSPRNAIVVVETNQRTLFLAATELRRILGYDQLKSTWFETETQPRKIIFRGNGYGHGVGLCQWGAKAQAEAGKTYRQILEFYYPKAVVKKIYQ